jgi:hypothetical protein
MSISIISQFLSDPPIYDFMLKENGILTQPWNAWFDNLLYSVTQSSNIFVNIDVSISPESYVLSERSLRGIRTLTIKDISGNSSVNNITITAENGLFIDGTLSKIINTNYGFINVYPYKNAWYTY